MSAEQALVFDVAGTPAVGVLSLPDAAQHAAAQDLGVLIVVGGPQYRVGSHRQFVLLARRLAQAGYPTLRFDVRGMGDAGGGQRSFETLSDDLGAAIDALLQARPSLRRVVLWGLCDGASAALLYLDERADARVAGLCLANPWVRSAASQARANVKHYYLDRLTQKDFWLKLLRGGVAVAALRGLWQNLLLARSGRSPDAAAGGGADVPFQARMARGWQKLTRPVLLLQSADDYTAREFDEFVAMDPLWRSFSGSAALTRIDLLGADHTLSGAAQRMRAEAETVAWLNVLSGRPLPQTPPY